MKIIKSLFPEFFCRSKEGTPKSPTFRFRDSQPIRKNTVTEKRTRCVFDQMAQIKAIRSSVNERKSMDLLETSISDEDVFVSPEQPKRKTNTEPSVHHP